VPFGPYLAKEYGIDPAQPRVLLGNVEPPVAEEIMGRWQDVKKTGVVVLVLDTSGSMSGDKLTQAKLGAVRFLDTVSPSNHVGLVTFSTSVNRVIPIGPIAKNKFDLAEGVNPTSAGGGTALSAAVKRAVELADAYPLSGDAIRGVILLSDGVNTGGSTQLCDVVKLTKAGSEEEVACPSGSSPGDSKTLKGSELAISTAHPIHIFSIAYGGDADLEVLRIFSEATNSTFKKATEKDVLEILETFGKYF
jgi:Ca-activated chloride channel family protein